MPCNSVTKKCGEIIVTMKSNAKNVYSFSCWYCDTICLQMKKLTLHLEQKHVNELEQSYSTSSKQNKDDVKTKIENSPDAENILIGEIKIEDCDANDKIKSELQEEDIKVVPSSNKDESSPNFQDPLEIFEEKLNETSLPIPIANNELSYLKYVQNIQLDNENEDVQMHNFSDEQHEEDQLEVSDRNDSTDSDFITKSETKETLKKPVKINIKTLDKELVFSLIEEYSKNPQLWNTTLAAKCTLNEKEDLLQCITDRLNEKLQIKLKLCMVKEKLNFICKQYENEIQRQLNQNEVTSDVDVNTDLWFYQNMSFLKTTIENKLKVKRKKTNHKVKPLNDNLLSDLVDIYKNYTSLWDVNHLAYTVKDKRHEIMQSMLEEVKNKMNISLDIYRLERHLNYIHKSFAKDKLTRLECENKEQDFQPICSYFDKCDFLETHQGPFKCCNCSDIIETYNDYQIHKSQHDGSKPFKCQECGMGFKKIANYTIHAKRHLRVFKFHCEFCGKGYPFNAELNLHMRSHTGAQPYLCSVCGEGFRTAISYDNHIRRHEERFKYFCHICKKGFNHLCRLNDHVKAHLNVRDIICKVCGKGFTSRKYLNHHKRIHEGKNYSCNICGKSFAQDAGLRAHKKYHGTPIGISSIQKEQNKYNLL